MTEPPDDVPPVPPDPPADLRAPLPADETPAEGPPPLPDNPFAVAVDLSPRPFRFTGSAGDYFRIWIVNLLLSVVTLGIYSAWAKVRRLRYFYGHTALDGGTFGYHASPIAILKGRLIAYAVVIVLGVLSNVAPLAASVLYLPLLMVMPIVLVRAFRFRAANSSYRGVRFGFDGMESEAYQVFLFWPVTVPFTLGLTYPYIAKLQREFFVGQSRHGQSAFALTMPAWPVYRIYLLAAVCGVAWLALIAIAMLGTILDGSARAGADVEVAPGPGMFVAVALLYAGVGLLVVAVRTAFENLVWNHTTIDEHRFESRLRARQMFLLYATNLLAIALTLGLAVPWARVRMARYRADCLTLLPGGPLVSQAQLGGAEEVATGAELSDAMDLDFGL